MMFSGVSYCAILPWLRISTRSDIVQASSGSWVTMMVVRLYWSTICLILALMDSLITPSSAESGSSSSSSLGFMTSVRASATRCF